MKRIPLEEIPILLRIEVWLQEEALVLQSYEQELTLPLSQTLRDYASRMGLPVPTAAYVIFKPQVEAVLRKEFHPYSVKVASAVPLPGLDAA